MSVTIQSIHETIRGIEREGIDKKQIKAICLHTDDLRDLLASRPEFQSGFSMEPGKIQILGIHIIDNPYIPKGSILKVFDESFDKPTYGTSWKIYPDKQYDLPTTTDILHNNNDQVPPTDKPKKHSESRRVELG